MAQGTSVVACPCGAVSRTQAALPQKHKLGAREPWRKSPTFSYLVGLAWQRPATKARSSGLGASRRCLLPVDLDLLLGNLRVMGEC